LLALSCSDLKAAQILYETHGQTGNVQDAGMQCRVWSERENGKKELEKMNAAQEGFHLCTANSLCHFFCFGLAHKHTQSCGSA